MVESRWLRWFGPGAIAVLAIAAAASTMAGAGQRPWAPPACGGGEDTASSAARSAAPLDVADVSTVPWYRLDPNLDRRGELQGQRLAFGIAGQGTNRSLELPPETFAAGPFGRTILVGADDGTTSQLAVVDVAAGCAWALGRESAVIRRATIDATGTTIYEMRVDRATRDDLGVWARPVDGGAPPRRVLDPLGPDEHFGRTFSTELTWDLGARRLVVQSCGETACRTRVLDPSGGPIEAVSEADLGVLVGVAGDDLVTYAACPGLPCPIVSTDLGTGRRTTLADDAAGAVLIPTEDGPRIVHERFGPAGVGLRSVAPDGSAGQELRDVPPDLRLQPAEASAGAATLLPEGWVVLSPDGRLPTTGPAGQVELRHVPDGASVRLEEDAR